MLYLIDLLCDTKRLKGNRKWDIRSMVKSCDIATERRKNMDMTAEELLNMFDMSIEQIGTTSDGIDKLLDILSRNPGLGFMDAVNLYTQYPDGRSKTEALEILKGCGRFRTFLFFKNSACKYRHVKVYSPDGLNSYKSIKMLSTSHIYAIISKWL